MWRSVTEQRASLKVSCDHFNRSGQGMFINYVLSKGNHGKLAAIYIFITNYVTGNWLKLKCNERPQNVTCILFLITSRPKEQNIIDSICYKYK